MPLPRLTLVKPPEREPTNDVALANALVRRDPGSSFLAWTRLRPVIDGTLRRLMGPEGDVADLRQEVFLRFFRQVTKLREAVVSWGPPS